MTEDDTFNVLRRSLPAAHALFREWSRRRDFTFQDFQDQLSKIGWTLSSLTNHPDFKSIDP